MDPLALRAKNALVAGDANATGQAYPGPWGSWQTIDAVEDPAPRARRALPAADGRYLYGRGVACLLQGISNGAEGVDVVGASVQVSQDGSALVGVGLADMGQGARTVCAQIASEVLGISAREDHGPAGRHRQRARLGPHGRLPQHHRGRQGGEDGRGGGEEVPRRHGGADVQGRGIRSSTSRDDFAVLTVDANARIPLRDVATAAYWTGLPPHAPRLLEGTRRGLRPRDPPGRRLHRLQLRHAPLRRAGRQRTRGRCEVLRHLACHDVGKVINPPGLEGQVEGGSLFGFGLAHLEEVLFRDGRIVNANFADYALPSIKDRLPTEAMAVEDPNPTGPFGAKGVGRAARGRGGGGLRQRRGRRHGRPVPPAAHHAAGHPARAGGGAHGKARREHDHADQKRPRRHLRAGRPARPRHRRRRRGRRGREDRGHRRDPRASRPATRSPAP